ncbi:MAG: hydantoinase B/oxoprolinase family protein [Gammaproteobacteria bacterium]|nr:hydantoinase B/oxoprolinase family protein [Gammaproteobacteria bacterium]NIR85598.1 hydantoinase B/oxoprolinase family protein [Gammaproteobacteria bacterium]NIR90039.1 hydantoinase B/oxoprolinase family protein [Gammaproteobacteria bacterium]NIU06727.1 hydantoinase B/oxoprolinase family protein [Gammaproteobacteria bacterium]NIV53658.1 hydantoinase B/oxoprolinase family protein [Gammaproteobacteria bacterium]
MSAPIDAVTLEVIRNGLSSIAEEMSLVVMRAARSPLLREAGDLSSALTDAAGELIAQGRDIPMHMGVMCFTVKAFLERVPPERLAPGDVWFLNLPEVGGNHLPDVKAIRPLFVGERLEGFAVSLAHWADIGGAVPGSYVPSATDAWQEGLRIAPLRLFSREGVDREKLDLVLANLRGAEEREGDALAQMAATRAAERGFHELVARHGVDTVRAAMGALHDRAETQMRAAIAKLPRGVYEGEDWLDDDGVDDRRIAIRARIDIGGDEAVFDFSDSDDAVRGPLNTTRFITAAAVYYVMKSLVGIDIQPSGGCYRPLRVVTRPGSVLDPDPARPVVGGNHETAQRVADAVFRALEPAAPALLSAGGPTTSGLLLFGARRADGRWATLYETHGGGEGARAERDGMPVVRVHLSNVMNTPAEVIEAEYPIRVECQRLRRGSGGAGRHRGGDGLHREYRILADDVSLTTMFERRIVPPYGLRGGAPGAPFRVHLITAAGQRREIPGKTNMHLGRGDRVVVESCGGGGYGGPGAGDDPARWRRGEAQEDASP